VEIDHKEDDEFCAIFVIRIGQASEDFAVYSVYRNGLFQI